MVSRPIRRDSNRNGSDPSSHREDSISIAFGLNGRSCANTKQPINLWVIEARARSALSAPSSKAKRAAAGEPITVRTVRYVLLDGAPPAPWVSVTNRTFNRAQNRSPSRSRLGARELNV